jgi:hypothetical protein
MNQRGVGIGKGPKAEPHFICVTFLPRQPAILCRPPENCELSDADYLLTQRLWTVSSTWGCSLRGSVMANTTRKFSFALCLLGAIPLTALGGCGVFTPEKGLLSNDDVDPPAPSPQGMFESNVVQHIQCEIRNGIWKASQLPNSAWLKTYGGQVTLKLVVQDQSALNPNASFLTLFGLKGAESFTLGIGGSGSANATRTEQIQYSYADGELWREAQIDARRGVPQNCESFQKGVLIDSNLKIGQFIYDKAVVAAAPGSQSKPFSQLQFEINFVAAFSGNITPTWKFTRTTVNGSGSLLSATRTDTDDVLITLGPLNADTKALHNAALIGSATGTSIQSQSH